MKKFASFLIGLTILLNGIHFMPKTAMASGMMKMSHCSECTIEDQIKGNCKPALGDQVDKEVLEELFPLGQECDCDFKQRNKDHHEVAISSQPNLLKGKSLVVHLTKSNLSASANQQNFLTVQKINAPPHAYLHDFRTIQQLK